LDYAGSIEGAGLANMSSSLVLPSRGKHWVGTRMALFGARFLARRCLCLHFTWNLTAPGARLEVKMDFAAPFLWGSFIPCCTPVYPGACAY